MSIFNWALLRFVDVCMVVFVWQIKIRHKGAFSILGAYIIETAIENQHRERYNENDGD